MTDVTVLIPYAPEHDTLVSQAIASVEMQTLPTEFVAMEDTDRHGPGWVRNRLLTGITTEYVLFLDADDWLEQNAIELMRGAIQPGRYVYSDWYVNGVHQQAPDQPWCQAGTWHCITCLCATDDVLRVGGFDERLPVMEDTDFWLKMNIDGVCGRRVTKPLFHYSGEGIRSMPYHQNGKENEIKQVLMQRYGGLPVGCCGQAPVLDTRPQGKKQAGDVLAMALWGGNHVERGRATGRRYPRMSYPKVAWVSPHDIKKSPRLWRRVEVGKEEVNEKQYVGVEGYAEAMIAAGIITPAPKMPEPTPVENMPVDYKLLNVDVTTRVFNPPLQTIAPDWDILVKLGAALYE